MEDNRGVSEAGRLSEESNGRISLRVERGENNDISLFLEEGGAPLFDSEGRIARVVFCSLSNGGGRSPHTRVALLELIKALSLDALQNPEGIPAYPESLRDRMLTAAEQSAPLELGKLRIDPVHHEVYWGGKLVLLSHAHFDLVRCLAKEPNRAYTYRELYDVVRGVGFVAGDGEHGIRSNVRSIFKRIRKAFEAVDKNFDAIENVPSVGYKWRMVEPAA